MKATLFGIPLPLCSCSVIPVTASLRKHGAGRGAATAFLISTPQTGVDSIFVTLALLGPVFAIFRPVAALVSGLLGGSAVDVLEPHGEDDAEAVEECEDACCAENGHGKVGKIFSYGFIDLPRDIGKALIIGILIAGVIGAAMKGKPLEDVGTGIPAILVMMLIGIPVYVCATASVPVAAALILTGVSPGAALAFLMTGPATNAAGIATVWKTMGRRTAIVYLAAVASTAFVSALLLDYIAGDIVIKWVEHVHESQPGAFGHVSAVVLLAVVGYALFRPTASKHNHDHGEPGDDCCHGEPKDDAAGDCCHTESQSGNEETGRDGDCCH